MANLIESVADLTNLRNQESLEIALAGLLFEQVEAIGLQLWRVARRDGKILLRELISLPGASASRSIAEAPVLELDQAQAELRQAFEEKAAICQQGEDGVSRHLFPVMNGRDVGCLLAVTVRPELTASQQAIILCVLQIFCNHLGVLNYGAHDELTGLLNRRTYNESFKRLARKLGNPALERRENDSTAPSHLAVIDIDFFKRINDQFGHPYGDEVLVLLARMMTESFRDTDLVYRFGGEEFVVILAETNFDTAEKALERFRAQVEEFTFSQVGRVTVSIGFTTLFNGDSGPSAFGRADQALYVCKHSGRNQIQSYERLIANGSLVSNEGQEQDVELF